MRDLERLLPDGAPDAPPRSNGELVFNAPWESRIFGLTLALHEAGRFEWPEFQAALIAAIERHEVTLAAAIERHEAEVPETYHYWACWLEAFRDVAAQQGWFSEPELARLEAELDARPHGHDH